MGNVIVKAAVKSVGAPFALSQQVLRTDASGMPLEWIDYKEAVRLHCLGQVAYAFGSRLYALHGGTNARTGRQIWRYRRELPPNIFTDWPEQFPLQKRGHSTLFGNRSFSSTIIGEQIYNPHRRALVFRKLAIVARCRRALAAYEATRFLVGGKWGNFIAFTICPARRAHGTAKESPRFQP